MAYYDLEEQEQISALQAWWKQWGALTLLVVALGIASVAAYQGWNWYKRDQATKASDMYQSVLKSARSGDPKQARDTATALVERFPSSGYASLAALVGARLSFDAGDLPAAKQSLQWVVDKSREEEIKTVARYRLAGVLMDEKQLDAALALLDIKPEDPLANLYADLRGDVLAAKGSVAEARASYQLALEKTDLKSPYRNLIQTKIDSLGQAK